MSPFEPFYASLLYRARASSLEGGRASFFEAIKENVLYNWWKSIMRVDFSLSKSNEKFNDRDQWILIDTTGALHARLLSLANCSQYQKSDHVKFW